MYYWHPLLLTFFLKLSVLKKIIFLVKNWCVDVQSLRIRLWVYEAETYCLISMNRRMCHELQPIFRCVFFALLQFSVFLGLIFFLELTAGILAFVFKDWIKDQLNFFIYNNVKAYRDDIDLQNLIDFAQEYASSPLPSFYFARVCPCWCLRCFSFKK